MTLPGRRSPSRRLDEHSSHPPRHRAHPARGYHESASNLVASPLTHRHAMDSINALLLIFGGILAVSGLIMAKQPNAKPDRQADPYQAIMGVALLGLGLFNPADPTRLWACQ